MLAHLRIRDLVLIEDLDLGLSPGLNVLTGETGAGKSLFATAVHLLLGGKAEGKIVRRGAEEAEVEGLFDVSDESRTRALLEEAGLPGGDELVVRRVIPADGRQRSYVNGRLASLALLGDLADGLASFASQHEHLALLDPAHQLSLLDAFGRHEKELAAMARSHREHREATERLERLRSLGEGREERRADLRFRLDELRSLAPKPDEIEVLSREAERLRHMETLLGASGRAADEIYEREDSLYDRLSAHARELERAASLDPELGEDAERVAEAAEMLAESARRLTRYAAGAAADPDRLEEVEARRNALLDLERKYGRSLAELLGDVEALEAELSELEGSEVALAEAQSEVDAAESRMAAAADSLSRVRAAAAKRFAAAAATELADLSLARARIEARTSRIEGSPGPLGADRLELMVALNPGEGVHPLRKVASGGELSRLMLALRGAAAGVGPMGTYVFDEVDAGIGGAVAQAVGRKLAEVARHHQVICITHLPQIAGFAGAHFAVEKATRDGRTRTEVRPLSEDERVREIARMLGGETLTESTQAAARELMNEGGGER